MATGKSRSEIQIHLRQLNGKRMVFSLLFFLALSFPTADSDARVTFASETLCGTGRATTANFIPKFVQSMEELSSNLNNSNNHFAVTNNTDPGTPPFFALIQCHEDLSRTDCLVCYAVSRTELPICLPRTSGRVFLDGCFLRYDNYSFFQEDVDPATDTNNCRSTVTNTNWNDFRGGFSEFDRSMVDLVENLTQSAVNNSGFGVMELNGVYGLAQCWKSLTTEQCRICMNKAKSEAVSCWPRREGRSMNAGCFFRYSTEKFYDNDPRADGGSSGTRRKTLVITVTTLFLGFIMTILIVIILCSRRKFKRRRNAKHGSVNVENFLKNHEFLAKRYSYLQVKNMTNTFEVKLGQGGFGIVYRGVLTDGNLVAVKILSELKGNGEDFINEVASVGKTSHVNIVSLVGFCCEGHRRALIYDFMPNGSLEKFIYEQPSISNRQLGWKKLYEIAIGIARGLEYLHSGCNTRILHFDIKPHNILLDQDFSPKISDFGLAKLFPEKRSMISMSHMRGTPGYIAPELFSRNFGQVSHKSDVYSYGMMILEMVGGRKNVEVEHQ